LGSALLKQQKWTEAEAVLRECLTIRRKKQPDDWTTFDTCSLLGAALLGQKKYADAEPPLVQGYEGMKQRETTIPPQGKVRLSEALERLGRLYEATDKKDKAKQGCMRREEIKTPKKDARKRTAGGESTNSSRRTSPSPQNANDSRTSLASVARSPRRHCRPLEGCGSRPA
jgi:hypothetical protein